MNTMEFFSYLRSLDIKIHLNGANLVCNAPQGILTPSLNAEIRRRGPELVSFLREVETAAGANRQAIGRIARAENIPLSFAQQRVWFLEQMDPGNVAYNMAIAVRLNGDLDQVAFEQSLSDIVTRHETLRTTFARRNGEMCQIIWPSVDIKPVVIDLSHLREAEQQEQSRQLIKREVLSPFDLAKPPLIKANLFRLSEREHLVLLTMHHIVSDGWSMGLLVNEISAFYKAHVTRRPPALKELRVTYADFTVWQRRWLQEEVLDKQLAYWKKQLGGRLPLLQLPTDRPRPAVQSHRGAHQLISLPASLVEKLRELGYRHGCTLFMVLLAAFQSLLARYCGQEDILVGTDIANRNRDDIEDLIGFFVNQLVMRTDLSGDPTFEEALARVKNVCLGGYAHQDVPFEKLVEALQPERDQSLSPLFQAKLALQNMPTVKPAEITGLAITPVEIETGTTKFDLLITLMEGPAGLYGTIEYSIDLYDDSTITRLVEHYRNVLHAVVDNPQQKLSSLPLLSEGERQQILVDWNNTRRDHSPALMLPQLFENQVEKTPGAVALIAGEESVTYTQLNARANQLAHYLRELGLETESLVGIYAERSVEMVVGMLAALKAGAAYVPIDPSYPSDRIAMILDDAQVGVVLTQEKLASELPLYWGHTVAIDAIWDEISAQPQSNPNLVVEPENAVYVLFTSGSTGRPKGVTVTCQGLTNHMLWMSRQFPLTSSDRILQKTPFSFDASVWEFYAPLIDGARLVLAEPLGHLNAGYLIAAINSYEITTIQLVPTLLRLLLDEPELSTCGSLRRVFVGGEILTSELVKRLKTMLDVEVYNLYGPTEATVDTSCHSCAGESETGIEAIGRPIDNVETYVLDSNLAAVPIGVRGEVYVGGEGLARGYLNQPAMTAEKFIPHPFSVRPGARLYQTSDIGRYLPGGTIECSGRSDAQVKVRGYRVELGEIEAAIKAHPNVKDCVVTVSDDEQGVGSLLAYVVSSQGLDAAELRRYLMSTLPDYMVPWSFISLESLPLMPNGKVDRSNLPVVEVGAAGAEASIAPRTPLEKTLAQIWAEVLKIDEVNIDDNFFALGGHSLLATQVVAHVLEATGLEIPLHTLFERPTVKELALYAAQELSELGEEFNPADVPVITPDPVARYEPFPLTDVQQAYWLGRTSAFELGNVSSHFYVEIEYERLDLPRFEHAWQMLIDRHDMLRVVIQADGNQRVLEHVPAYQIQITDLRDTDSRSTEETLAATRARMSHQVLKADQWPIFEICASLLNGDRTRLHISMDALVCDAWSLFVLTREFVQLYLEPGTELPPLELRFRDYVIGERELRETELYERSLTYWKERLETLPGAPELPLVKSPGELETPRFVRRRGVLSKESWSGLKERAARAGVTASGVLLAAYAEVLGRWSKTAEFTLNLTLFNRLPLHEEVGQVVGDFTSLTLLEVRQSGGESFELRARRLQEQLWADLDQRYVSGVRVMRELGRARPGARAAAFPVVFTSALIYDQPTEEVPAELAEAKIIYGITQTPQVWLDQQVTERGGELWYNWDSLEELFPAGLLDDMVAAYGELLERLSSSAAAWSEVERELLPSWQWQECAVANATAGRESEELLHTLFAQQVLAGPGREAVLSERRGLSYEELLWEAEALSEELLVAGVGVGELVGVVMEKGWEQVVAVLAVLRAGGAYLPIEAGLPAERIEYLLRDGGVQVVLTQPWIGEGVTAGVVWLAAVPRVLAVRERATAARSEVPRSEVEAVARQWLEERRQGQEDLAYVIYTSGSTGTPKGVMITHAGAVNTIVDVNERYGVGAEDRVLGLSSLSFDLSVYDVFGVLGAGGALVLPAESERKEARAWAELVRQYGVTVWNSVPALMQMLVESWEAGEEHEAGAGLRLVLLSGDWVPVRLPAAVRERWREAQVVSMGGATEASIWSILYEVGEVEAQWRSIPYGKPMRNQEFRVVNRNGAACPVWVAGELEIGGAGVALGYWGDAERTQERFRTDKDGARWYRTGDLGRYLPGGEIEFLGREDGQVKVRGHRVELGEISAVLGRHPEVAAAVTRAVGEREAGRRLIAYVVPHPGQSDQPVDLDSDLLRAFLEEKLPEYMIPSAFVFLETLPLTANGKIDIKALPVPDQTGSSKTAGFLAPGTPLEELIAEQWADILKVGEVGVRDDFFELGGDSLTGTYLVSRLRETLKVEIPLRQLFETPTIAGIAEYVQTTKRGEISSLIPPLTPATTTDHPPLSFAQEGVWFLNQLSPHDVSYNIVGALRLTGRLDSNALSMTINEILTRHDSLRTTFAVVEGRPVQVIDEPKSIDLPLIDFTALPVDQRQTAARDCCTTESLQPFNLASGPLIRVVLLKLNIEEHILFFNMHHIVSDAWSLQVLAREVATLYPALAKGETSPLPALPVRYADFAIWQRQWLQGAALENELNYWRTQLRDAPVPEFPADYPRPDSRDGRGKSLIRLLPESLVRELRLIGGRERATLFMTMLAAFKVLVSFYTGHQEVVIGSSIANRNRPEIQGLIGLFVNILVLRTNLTGNPTFSELVGRVREVTLEAYLHQDLPFEKLVKELNPERDPTNQAPFLRVLFVHELPMRQLEVPGLTITNVELEADVSRHDLNLHIIETNGETKAVLQYNSSLFAPETATKILDQYEAVLLKIVANTNVTLDELLVTVAENEQNYQARRREARKRKDIAELRQVVRN